MANDMALPVFFASYFFFSRRRKARASLNRIEGKMKKKRTITFRCNYSLDTESTLAGGGGGSDGGAPRGENIQKEKKNPQPQREKRLNLKPMTHVANMMNNHCTFINLLFCSIHQTWLPFFFSRPTRAAGREEAAGRVSLIVDSTQSLLLTSNESGRWLLSIKIFTAGQKVNGKTGDTRPIF